MSRHHLLVAIPISSGRRVKRLRNVLVLDLVGSPWPAINNISPTPIQRANHKSTRRKKPDISSVRSTTKGPRERLLIYSKGSVDGSRRTTQTKPVTQPVNPAMGSNGPTP